METSISMETSSVVQVQRTKKKKRVSKKNKKNWRKHADVKDVEEYLEGRRREEIFGVPAIEKSADDLFFVHKVASATGDPAQSKLLTRKDLRLKPLKSEINLHPNPAIKGFPTRKRANKSGRKHASMDTVSSSVHLVDSSGDEEVGQSLSHKTIRKEYNGRLLAHSREHPDKDTVHVASKDLWSEEPKVTMNDDHYLKVTRKMKVKKPSSMMEMPSLLQSVEIPHPGMSYNPTFQDHQDLLRKALVIEEKKMKAAQRLERRLQLSSMTHVQREKVWQVEMSEGILGLGWQEGKESDGAGSEGEGEEGQTLSKRRPIRAEERKTKKQRRKEHLRRKEEMLRKISKGHKMKMDEVYRLRSIKKEIAQREAATCKKHAETLALKQLSPYLTKRLGRQVFEEPSIPLQLSSEVSGSLRMLKPEGSIAVERFKSLQRRNIIEPRQLVRPHRKYKLLIKEKRSAKIEEDKNY